MSVIDLGGGQTAKREHLPEHLLHAFDQANAAVEHATANIRNWIRPLYTMKAPDGFGGSVSCTAIGQSGRTYVLANEGATLDVDERDVPSFRRLKFTMAETP